MVKMLNPHYVDTIGASYLFPVVNHGQVSPKYTVDIASAGIGKRWDQITLIVSMEVNATMPIAVPFVVSNNKITAPMLEVRKRSSTAIYRAMAERWEISVDIDFNIKIVYL